MPVLAADFATANRRWKGAAVTVGGLGYGESGGDDFDQSDLNSVNAAVASVENNGGTVFASSGDAGGLDCTPANDGGQPPQVHLRRGGRPGRSCAQRGPAWVAPP